MGAANGMNTRITIVGCGPGGEGWLSDVAQQAIAGADRIAGTPALLERFAPAGVERIVVHGDIEAGLNRIAEHGETRSTAVLVTGDPGICSLAKSVIRRFGRETCRVIPGVSSVQAAFAALGLDWTAARIIGGHAQPPDMAPAELRNVPLVAVLTGHPQTGDWLSQVAALPGCRWQIHACRDLTLPTECVEAITADQLPAAAAQPRTIVILERAPIPSSSDPRPSSPHQKSLRDHGAGQAPGTFYGIGTGPGDPGWLTVHGAQRLGTCRHVFAPKARIKSESLAQTIARPHIAPDATIHELLFPMTKDENELAVHWRAAAEEVAAVLERGEDACFLTIGDPMLYSTYVYLLRALRERLPELKAETIPGVTSFCAAAALTGFALGEGKAPVTIVPTADDLTAVRDAVRRGGTVVLMKIGSRLPHVLEVLRQEGCLEQAVLVSRAGQPEQRIVTNLRELPPEAPDVGYLSVILVTSRSRLTPNTSHLTPGTPPLVHFVGAGPGDPELLTVKAARLLATCRCCIYAGSLVSPGVLALLPADAEKHDSASMTLEQTTEACRSAVARGVSVVRLHSGDPSIYGAIREQMNEFDKLGIAYDVVPGVSSFQAAAAALKTELTAPEVAQTIILTRTSGRTPLPPEQELDRLAQSHATLCIFLSVQRLDDVAETLARHYGADCPAAVVYRASWPDQQIIRGTLSDIAGQVAEADVSKTAMIIVGQALGRDIAASRLYDATFSHEYRKGAEA